MDTNTALVELANLITAHFNRTEILTLCFDLGIDHEEIAGHDSPNSLLVRQIIAYLMRRGRLGDLLNIIHYTRPSVKLPQISDVESAEKGEQRQYSIKRNLQIFICHAQEDKPIVREIYSKLRDDGYQPWFDEESLIPGQDWRIGIEQALRSSDVVLVCSSKESVGKTGFVQKELRDAIDLAQMQPEGVIFLIPIKLDDCELPEYLNRYQWVEYSRVDGYQRLTRALHAKAASLGIRPNPTFHYQNLSSEGTNSLHVKTMESEGRTADRRTLARVQELLPSYSMVPLLKDFDFGGAFFRTDIDPLFKFSHECQLPEFGFLDDELEHLRIDLADAVEKLCRALGQHTSPNPNKPGLSDISDELKYNHRELWNAARDEMNQKASRAYDAYVKLIRSARKKLLI